MKEKILSCILITIVLILIAIILIFGHVIKQKIEDIEKIGNYENVETVLPNEKENVIDEKEDANVSINNDNNLKNEGKLYKQLNKTSKIIYDKLYSNKENLKSGRYKVQFDNIFYSTLIKNEGEKELKKSYQSAIEAFMYENPDIFYLDVSKMYLNIEKTTKITGIKFNVYIDNGNEYSYLIEPFLTKDDIDICEKEIEVETNKIVEYCKDKTDYEKIKIVHDYLVETITYEQNMTRNHIYNIYGGLVEKRCVCEGYAKTFQYLMNKLEIDCSIVIGTATNSKNETENHAWNYVKLNNAWYGIDVTWDDPIFIGKGKLTKENKYQYFLKGYNTMNKNHYPSGRFTKNGMIFKYPEISENDFKFKE